MNLYRPIEDFEIAAILKALDDKGAFSSFLTLDEINEAVNNARHYQNQIQNEHYWDQVHCVQLNEQELNIMKYYASQQPAAYTNAPTQVVAPRNSSAPQNLTSEYSEPRPQLNPARKKALAFLGISTLLAAIFTGGVLGLKNNVAVNGNNNPETSDRIQVGKPDPNQPKAESEKPKPVESPKPILVKNPVPDQPVEPTQPRSERRNRLTQNQGEESSPKPRYNNNPPPIRDYERRAGLPNEGYVAPPKRGTPKPKVNPTPQPSTTPTPESQPVNKDMDVIVPTTKPDPVPPKNVTPTPIPDAPSVVVPTVPVNQPQTS
ncbi:MAG: hypothetical protein ACRCXZ_08025, partial [Patescibacteria group bacterium]